MPSKTAKPVPSDDVPLKKMDITQFWLAEDKDAESRSADEDMFETRNIVSQIRELVNREKVPLEKSKREQLMVSLANLRRYNRSMQLKLKAVREQTAQRRSLIEAGHLQLQNLIHEVAHLQREVSHCLQFKSAHEQIELISLDEFLKESPQAPAENSHELRLARLQHELKMRKELSSHLEENSIRLQVLKTDVAAGQERLDSLYPGVQRILETCRPVEEALNTKYELRAAQSLLIKHLSSPLFIIYRQIKATKPPKGCEIQTLIFGNPEADSKKGEDETEDSDEDDDEEGLVDHSRRERSEDVNFSGNENEDLIANTVAKQNRKRRKSSAAVSNQKQREKLFEYHPMSIALEFSRQDLTIVVHFKYLRLLKVITTNCEVKGVQAPVPPLFSGESLIADLFGSELDNLNVDALAMLEYHRVTQEEISSRLRAMCPDWAQQLAGISTNTTKDTPVLTASNLLQALNNRLAARAELSSQIIRLESLNFPIPAGLLCPPRLLSWRPITVEQARAVVSGNSDWKIIDESSWFYQATLRAYKGDMEVVAVISISINYPNFPPICMLVDDAWQPNQRAVNRRSPQQRQDLLGLMQRIAAFVTPVPVPGRSRKGRDRRLPMEAADAGGYTFSL